MKPDERGPHDDAEAAQVPVRGDVIGDTAYSQRFVLRILLKLANSDTLKEDIQASSFEKDLCTLWDMTADRDVVLFLQKHDIFNLLNFALPVVNSPRIMEIIIGIIGNMCCQKEAVYILLKMERLLPLLLEYITSDDSLILIQLLRLVSSSLFLANSDDLFVWMQLFKNVEYSSALYFILKNSSNKDLLSTALENTNAICSYFNTEKFSTDFYSQFVTEDALESLVGAFTEIIINHKEECGKDEIERTLLISLQITLNLLGFENSIQVYNSSKLSVATMLHFVVSYYENKLVNHKEIDTDLVDIIESSNTIIGLLQLSELSEPDKFFSKSYNIWKTLKSMQTDKNGVSAFEEEDRVELQDFPQQLRGPLSRLLCLYMEKCSDESLLKVLDDIGEDYDDILNSQTNGNVRTNILNRAVNYRTRLTENVDS